MRKRIKPLQLSILAIALASVVPCSAQDFALVNATVWTMTDSDPVENATIVVNDGRIVSVTANGTVPDGLSSISVHGQIVTPGFFNAATQIGLVEAGGASDTRDMASSWDGVGAGFDVSYAINGNSVLVDLARSDGLTEALVYPSKSKKLPFAGLASSLRLRDQLDIVDRPRVGLVAFFGGGAWKKEAGSRAAEWQALRIHLSSVMSVVDRDNDKPGRDRKGTGGSPEQRSQDIDNQALQMVLSRKIPLIAFIDRESDISQAIQLANDFNIKLIIVGGAQAWRVADRLAAANVPIILSPADDLPYSYDELAARSDNAAKLSRAGVHIAFGPVGGRIGSNYNAGIALREEAGLAVRNGLPYYEALKAVTSAPFDIFGLAEKGGTISVGSRADFVVWDGDPIEPSSLALHVFVEGREVSHTTRQDKLGDRYLNRK